KTSIFSHPVYLFLRKFSLQDSRGGSGTDRATSLVLRCSDNKTDAYLSFNDYMGLKWSTKTGHRVRVFPVSIFRFVWG
ncbi:hypothetical protein JZL84_25545, partial [Escherichia coli]|nr:hypothetical protein [Escherichia coli]